MSNEIKDKLFDMINEYMKRYGTMPTVAYLVIFMGRKMIWDRTGKNSDLLQKDEFATYYAECIFCNRKWGK